MARPSLQDWILTSRPHPGLRRTIAFGSIRLHPGLGQESRPSRAPGKARTDDRRVVDGLPKRVPLFCPSICHSEGGHICSAQAARSRSPERAATLKNSPGCSRRASSEPAESRVRRSPRDESCRDDTPRASRCIEALEIRPPWQDRPFRTGFSLRDLTQGCVEPSPSARFDSTLGWVRRAALPGLRERPGQTFAASWTACRNAFPYSAFRHVTRKAGILVQLKLLVPGALKGRPLPKTALDAADEHPASRRNPGCGDPPETSPVGTTLPVRRQASKHSRLGRRGKTVPSGLDSHFATSPRVASNHRLRLDSTPPWAGSGEPPFQGSGKGQDRRSPRRGRPAETRSPILPFESAPKKAKILVQLKRLVPRALKGRPLPKTALDAAASIQRASGIQGAAIPPRRVL